MKGDDSQFDSEGLEPTSAEFLQLEGVIFSARHYVIPSEDLRPRTLEIARECSQSQRAFRRLGLFSIACLFAWIACLPTGHALSALRHHLVATSSEEMQHLAFELSAQSGYGPDWGLVDAFLKLRAVRQDGTDSTPVN